MKIHRQYRADKFTEQELEEAVTNMIEKIVDTTIEEIRTKWEDAKITNANIASNCFAVLLQTESRLNEKMLEVVADPTFHEMIKNRAKEKKNEKT